MSSAEEEDSLEISNEVPLPRLSRSATVERRGKLFVINKEYDPGRMFDPQAAELETMADQLYTDSMKLSAKANRYATVYKWLWYFTVFFIVVSGIIIAALSVEDKKKNASDYVVAILGGLTSGSMITAFAGKVVERGVEYKKRSIKLRELGTQASHDKLEIKDPAELYQKLNRAYRKLNNLDLEIYQIGIGDSGKRASQLAEMSASAKGSMMSSPEDSGGDYSSEDNIDSDSGEDSGRDSGGEDGNVNYGNNGYDNNIFNLSNIPLPNQDDINNRRKDSNKLKGNKNNGNKGNSRNNGANKKSQSMFDILRRSGKSKAKLSGKESDKKSSKQSGKSSKGKFKRKGHTRSLDEISINNISEDRGSGSNSNNDSNSTINNSPDGSPSGSPDGSPSNSTEASPDGSPDTSPRISDINERLGGKQNNKTTNIANNDKNTGRFRVRSLTPQYQTTNDKGKGKEKRKANIGSGRAKKPNTVAFKLEDSDEHNNIDIRSTTIVPNPFYQENLDILELHAVQTSPTTDDLRLMQMEEGNSDGDADSNENDSAER